MPGNYHFSIDRLVEECRQVRALGIPAVLLFGIPPSKDAEGSGAYAEAGIIPSAVRAVKAAEPDLLVITDVCLCEYTSHGHCGRVRDGDVDNDATLDLLARTALAYARAGADLVAPSDMMDGRVEAIRDPAGRSRIRKDPDPVLRRQIRLRVLRALPGGRRLGPSIRGPALLSDGPRQSAGGSARGRPGHRGGG